MLTRLRLNTPLPDLTGATEWINGPFDHAALAGRPVLVYFWSASCHLCHETLPTIAEWHRRYGPYGLQFVAIHVPRQASDTQVQLVRSLAAQHNIADPCGVDNQLAVAAAFSSEYVPAFFFFDASGKLRGRAGGVHGLALLEQTIQRYVLGESHARDISERPDFADRYVRRIAGAA